MKAILAVKDIAAAEALHLSLSRHDFEVATYPGKEETLKAIKGLEHPSVVIIEMRADDDTLEQVADEVVDSELSQRVHILALGSAGDKSEVDEAFRLGASDYMPMPFDDVAFASRLHVAESNLSRLAKFGKLARQFLELKDSLQGRYNLKRKIGQGGLGDVFEGWDSSLDRRVAIKRFRVDASIEKLSDDEMWREARITASLNHPNIVTVYDCWSSTGGAFVVMELLDGISLEDFISKEGPAPVLLFENITRQILSGLVAAHSAGILHCDLKPSNIMLIGDPRIDPAGVSVKILDFGVAKLVQEIQPDYLQNVSTVDGSPFFIAPEVFCCESLDQRSDLYSFGQILYNTLAGTKAVTGKTIDEVLDSHLEGRFKHLSEQRDDISYSICDWVMSLMRRQPEYRPASSLDALGEFRGLLLERDQALGTA